MPALTAKVPQRTNKSSYWNKGSLVVIMICNLVAIIMLQGALGQVIDETLEGLDDVTDAFVPTPDSLEGLWNLSLTCQEFRYLYLNLSLANEYIFGWGILGLDNSSQQVTAVGWDEEDHHILYIVTSDGREMIGIQLTEEWGIISGQYESYNKIGNKSNGEVHGSKIVDEMVVSGPPFGIKPEEYFKCATVPLDQTNLEGSWNLSLAGQRVQHLDLNLSITDKYLFGWGILVLNDTSQQVTAVGWDGEEYQILFVAKSDSCEIIEIQLTEQGGNVSGQYESYNKIGNKSNGEVHGSRIVDIVDTAEPPLIEISVQLTENINR